jgi:hypothetical protein
MNPWAFVFHPSLLIRRLFRRWGSFSTQTKLDLDLFPRPYYAYGLHQACVQAKRLGIARISALEFGVAGGTGLCTIEAIAEELETFTGVKIDVYGFDTGQGLPAAPDPRDLPYVWQRGFYKMDEAALRKKLRRAKLILGPVAETVGGFVTSHSPAPVGFISFDMDYYTSTMDAFRLFDENPPATFLPRVFCYFDDIIGRDEELHCEFVGELLAIEEFNRRHEQKKIGQIYGLAHKRIIHAGWCEQMFVLHDLGHPRYCEYASGERDKQLKLG